MGYITLISILSAICSILSFITSKVFKSKIWIWIIVVFLQTFACGYIVLKNSELERINNIHRQATVIYEHYNAYGGHKEYIQEVLTFLEEHKDRYGDAYKRATQIYHDMKKQSIQYDSEPAQELHGIMKSIVAMNDE